MAGITKNVFQFSLDGKFVKEWKSASDAARELGVTPQGIYECLKERFVAYGYADSNVESVVQCGMESDC